MTLPRTAAILEVIEAAVADGQLVGPTQSFMAQYLAVVLYAEIEERLGEIVTQHLTRYTNQSVATFIARSLSDLIRRTPKSDIAKLLERFGDTFRENFLARIREDQISRYSNVITARHEIGHKRGSNITVAEVRLGHAAAIQILAAIEDCLAHVSQPSPMPKT